MTLAVRAAIMLVFGTFGVVMLWVGVTQYFQQKRLLARASAIEAEIIESRVKSSTSSNMDRRPLRSTSTTTHAPVMRFRYTLGGAVYESDMLRPSIIERTYASADDARAELSPFPVGARVTAMVDPSLPERAFLVNEASAAPVVFVIVGLLVPPLAFLAGKLV